MHNAARALSLNTKKLAGGAAEPDSRETTERPGTGVDSYSVATHDRHRAGGVAMHDNEPEIFLAIQKLSADPEKVLTRLFAQRNARPNTRMNK